MERKAHDLKPLKLVFSYARHYKLVLTITIISMFLLVGVQLVIPEVIRRLIAAVTAPTISPLSFKLVGTLTLVVLGMFLLRAAMQFLRSYMAHLAGWGVVADVRKHIYEHLQALSLRFYEDKQTGQLMSRVINDTELFEQLISHAVPDVVVNVITLVGVSVILLNLNWQLTLLSHDPHPVGRHFFAGVCSLCAPGLSRAAKRARQSQCHPERQPFRHPRDQGIYPRSGGDEAHQPGHRPLPDFTAWRTQADGNFPTFY